MKGNQRQNKGEEGELRMELKYCERCGGLWLRECGVGVVYCANCESEVADLPVPKKKPQRVRVPARPQSVAEDYRFGRKQNRFDESLSNDHPDDDFQNNDGRDLEASGGAA
jgi:uncharacterized Zn finger protein (UPF0148 family)